MLHEFIHSETTRDQAIQHLKEKLERYEAELQLATKVQTEIKNLPSILDTPTLIEIFSGYQPLPEIKQLTRGRLDRDLEICQKCRKECKHILREGKITYEKCKKIYFEIDSVYKQLWRVRHGPGGPIRIYPNLLMFKDMINEAQEDKIVRSIFHREKINVESVGILSYVIRKTEKHIRLYKKEIKYLLRMPVYPEADAIKFNSLNIDPQDKKDYNAFIESLREQYEKYALDNNLCPEYFAIIQLIEEYYILKKEPHPEIRKYRQFESNDKLKNMVHHISQVMLVDPKMDDKRKVLQLLVNEPISPQEYLIRECNKHFIDWLDQNVAIEFKCPKHEKCITNNRQERCRSGTEMKLKLDKDSSFYKYKLDPKIFTLNSDYNELKCCYELVM